MPLISSHRALSFVDGSPWLIAVMMQVDGSDPPIFVNVFVARDFLVGLDSSGAVDKANALNVAEGDRMRIETAASDKFDKIGGSEITLVADDLA